MKEKTGRRSRLWAICAILLILLLIGAELIRSNYSLTVSRYEVRSEKVTGAFCVVQVSDLHGREFGKDNRRLLEKIAAEQPDIIALIGDIINNDADADEIDRMCRFIQRSSEIAPVYFSLGNHEQGYLQKSRDTDFLERIRNSGAVVLSNEYVDVEIHGTPIRIGGGEGYYRQPIMTTNDPVQQRQALMFADEFEETDRFTLLLDHIPTGWLDWHNVDRFPLDLVLSGHYHGGLIRIPILEQGLYAPYVGKFPPYTKGMFVGKEATCILTTGLAGSKLPRFFNPPEIVVVDIVSAE